MTPEDKIKEYIERAIEIKNTFRHDLKYEIIVPLVAQMLQREEHFNSNKE